MEFNENTPETWLAERKCKRIDGIKKKRTKMLKNLRIANANRQQKPAKDVQRLVEDGDLKEQNPGIMKNLAIMEKFEEN